MFMQMIYRMFNIAVGIDWIFIVRLTDYYFVLVKLVISYFFIAYLLSSSTKYTKNLNLCLNISIILY